MARRDDDKLSDDIFERWDPKKLVKEMSGRIGRGAPLDTITRARYERRLGVSLADVRLVHAHSSPWARGFLRDRGAQAVTVGNTGIVIMGGAADRSPVTRRGRGLLAHELTHVAQAKRGLQFKLHQGGAESPTEAEARVMEAKEEGGQLDEETPAAASSDDEFTEEDRRAVIDRVLSMVADAEWAELRRNGDPPRRW